MNTTVLYVIIFIILLAILYYIQKQRAIVLPEGFTSDSLEYPKSDFDIQNPLLRIVKKLGVMSTYLIDPTVWKDAYNQSKMSAVELARMQIAKDKKTQGK
jgi:hypothetical protein